MWKRAIARTFDEHWVKDPETGCHNWQRSLDDDGYGHRFRINGQRIRPHQQHVISQIVLRKTWRHV